MYKTRFRLVTLITLFTVLGIILLIWSLFPLFHQKEPVKASVPKSHIAYNLALDSVDITYGKVKGNQNLSALLAKLVSPQIIDRIGKSTCEIFDVRKIRSGNTYARITSRDSARRTLFFIYEINPIDFVVYDFRDSLRVYRDKKNVKMNVKTATGTITSSLWNCFAEQNLDVELGLALSDVYAWTVDFYGLQRGDHFKVIYEEVHVDGRMVGIEKILAAVFSSGNKDFFAFYFPQQGKPAYFDEKGQSLQRSFLKAPLKFSRISSRFSRARKHPILRIVRPHYGVDYSAPRGTPVVSLGDGRVGEAGFKGGYGRFISIHHNSSYTTTYAHLSGYAKGLKAGNHVSQGEVIGYVGSSGLSTGPHLDFRVYKNGKPIDPLRLESPHAKPVDSRDIPSFSKTVQKYRNQLSD
ncbi:MAG: peptidoglycan DD-metalloendopeptidase family protein [Bacteroidales bacterium]|nr:peptidoglycan DD-metalloendopeptidase family protein [Bacteroidales bacterium]